ncbi:MAG: inosine-5-monophosphate dehydrogenase [Candidatus Omnitrophota bacterium]|nr:MAG: inosine-5-monophosphate dehydrogenase [Candidatus Omnitrophota bacterium]
MFEIKTIMHKNVFTVGIDTPIYDAMRILIERKISGLPVVDAQNKLLGIISEKDMLKLLFDHEIRTKQTVADYMTKDVKSFTPDASAITLCEFFINHPFRRVPIVENGCLAGIVSRRDIIDLILKIRGQKKQ